MRKKEVLKLNKPIYVACTVLELSKLAMYECYYDFLMEKCENFNLLYMDTDSFIIEVIGENFDDIMLGNKEYLDLKNVSKKSVYYADENKKIPGKMKDEYGGTPILEYVGAEPKSYALIDINNYEESVHQGHSSNFQSSKFKDVVNNKNVIRHPMKKITSKKLIIYTEDSYKISLSCFDDKRYIIDDGINTLPFGHKNISNNI